MKLHKTLGLLALISMIIISSCRTEGNTIAIVSVVDEDGYAVSNAMVVLLGTPTVSPHNEVVRNDTVYTSATGTSTFDYTEAFQLGSAGFAVLDIIVEKTDTSGALLEGRGIIKVEEETTSEEVIVALCTSGC